MIGWIAHALVALALMALTQVGGVIYLAALAVRTRLPVLRQRPRLALVALFAGLYAAAWLPIQSAAALAGRVGLPCTEHDGLRAASPLSCVLHRHYVDPRMLALAHGMARAVDERYPGTLTQTLDANFPFLDGFPMAPHLSHDDGDKLDVAFYYADTEGTYRRGVLRSPIGYWAFEQPGPHARQPCRGRAGALRWDQDWFQPLVRDDLVLDGRRLRTAITWLETEGRARGARRVLLEAHLADRLQLDPRFVRFQGCSAARHDDHFHIELR
jgi:hypothetical protein